MVQLSTNQVPDMQCLCACWQGTLGGWSSGACSCIYISEQIVYLGLILESLGL
jgi:hypothetical protein